MSQMIPTNMQKAVLLFIKYTGTPVILYGEDPMKLYAKLLSHMKNADPANPRLIEQAGVGPVKRIAVHDTDISSIAIQEEMLPDDQGDMGSFSQGTPMAP